MLCPVYGHELTPLSCPPSQGVSFRSFKGLIILSPYNRISGRGELDRASPQKNVQKILDVIIEIGDENMRDIFGSRKTT